MEFDRNGDFSHTDINASTYTPQSSGTVLSWLLFENYGKTHLSYAKSFVLYDRGEDFHGLDPFSFLSSLLFSGKERESSGYQSINIETARKLNASLEASRLSEFAEGQ